MWCPCNMMWIKCLLAPEILFSRPNVYFHSFSIVTTKKHLKHADWLTWLAKTTQEYSNVSNVWQQAFKGKKRHVGTCRILVMVTDSSIYWKIGQHGLKLSLGEKKYHIKNMTFIYVSFNSFMDYRIRTIFCARIMGWKSMCNHYV